jgi:hypothetical protein
MGRPPLPVGTYGKDPGVRDGGEAVPGLPVVSRRRVTRPVERIGRSRTAAADNRAALHDRGRGTLAWEITPDTKVAAVAVRHDAIDANPVR